MNSFMKLFSIFILLIQVQVALSQPIQTSGPNLIQQLCKRNRYQSLCISTLNLDPRSKTSNLQGLASIAVDATSKKVSETSQYIVSILKDVGGIREEFERYGTCIDQDYGASERRFIPALLADLKAKKYYQAMSEIRNVALAANDCEAQFTGTTSRLTGRNKAVHDIADMTADIIKTFIN